MNSSESNGPFWGNKAFHVMAKPVGAQCNLNCRYCFYLEKEALFPSENRFLMSDETLERHVRSTMECCRAAEVQFAWQGGEPAMAGLAFYQKAVQLQKKYGDGRKVLNIFQTNGTLLNDEWCRFFAEEHFLVGLSLDGPEAIHNRYRNDKGGQGSFLEVMRALELLKKHDVAFNTLTCITRQSPDEAVEIYDFLKAQEIVFMQFIPIVEQRKGRPGSVTPWSVSAQGYGHFLNAIFDEWVAKDVGRIFVNIFDVMLGLWCGGPATLCVFAETCGTAVALEHDGGLYACDHFVEPEYYLGNINQTPANALVASEQQQRFGGDKRDKLPGYCRACEFFTVCNGGCPKHRFLKTPDGEAGLNYLCPGFKLFFEHITPAMGNMVALLRSGRNAADIMQTYPSTSQDRVPKRNEPCSCGSGRKYKKCCGKSG